MLRANRPAEAPMKITVNVDCTPEEARAFLGLPDLKPIQDQVMQEMQQRMAAGIHAAAPEELMRAWAPAMKGFEQLQSMFTQLGGVTRE
jgi:hypothetical protein